MIGICNVHILIAILLLLASCSGEDRAEVNVRVSGACSPTFLSMKGVDVTRFRPSIRFNPDKVFLDPKSPAIPGCVKIKAFGVEIVRPVKRLVAEIEMRISGTPNPEQPVLPCSKKLDKRVNQCPCAKIEKSCLFCDFCRQFNDQSPVFIKRNSTNQRITDDSCECKILSPGLYDIETEMCTPELDDIKEYIPTEIQNDIVEKRPISMFITVYLMDLEHREKESYLSTFGQAVLKRRMAQNMLACFLMGMDVKVDMMNQQ